MEMKVSDFIESEICNSEKRIYVVLNSNSRGYTILCMKELYREIKINKPGLRFLPELSLSGLAEVVYFDLRLYFLHGYGIT